MANNEKTSSANNNNNVLSPETIKSQLKAACKGMDAAQTKEYVKGLAGYEIRLTGQRPTQHYTIFYGDVRVCNVEQVQGIKADGSSRGSVSTPKIKSFLDAFCSMFDKTNGKLCAELNEDERQKLQKAFDAADKQLGIIDELFEAANARAAAKAKEAAKEAAKIKKVEKLVTSMTPEQMAKQIELLQRAMQAMQAAS